MNDVGSIDVGSNDVGSNDGGTHEGPQPGRTGGWRPVYEVGPTTAYALFRASSAGHAVPMMRVVRGLVFGAALGLFFGALARALMRLVAIGMGDEPELDVGVSVTLIGLFVISGAGAGAARAARIPTWGRALTIVVTSAPLLLTGAAFGVGEVAEILDRDLTPPWTIELLLVSVVILAMVLLTPYTGWRGGRRAARSRTE